MYESTDIMSTMPEEHWKYFLGETVGKQTHLQPTARRYSSVYAMTLYPMSVRLSVCLSVTSRSSTKMAKCSLTRV